jgi:predicted O-methyltransferase YrrM
MTDIRARNIKEYVSGLFGSEDEILQQVVERSIKAKLPKIRVPANIGKLLYMFVKMVNPKRVLEIGTLGGYSAIWMARALTKEASLTTIELDEARALIAKENFILAGLQDKIEIKIGLAVEILDNMIHYSKDLFDIIFIDADKENYPVYLDMALKLSKPGTVILCDNVIPRGVEMHGQTQIDAVNIYKFNDKIASHPNLDSTIIHTIVNDLEFGRIDGLAICLVK